MRRKIKRSISRPHALHRTAPAPRLPAELTDVIIDFLHDDKKSLTNCSLVCREWLPATRYHIFREVFLFGWNAERFRKLVAHPTTTIARHQIHSVVIHQGKPQLIGLYDMEFLPLRPFDFVRTLKLRNTCGSDYTEITTVDKLASAFQNVTDMRLVNCYFNNTRDLRYLVARFPSLQRLSVTDPRFLFSIPCPDIIDILPPSKIHYLALSETPRDPTDLFIWFSFYGILVDTLSVRLGSAALPSLNHYLQMLGPSLLFFTMEIWPGREGSFLPELDLSFNTHLRKLCFLHLNFKLRDALLSMIPSMFAKITSSHLGEIEFVHTLELDATPSSSMWSALDSVLSGFSSLRTVRFIIHLHQSHSLSFAGYVTRGLSTCNARGLLSIEYSIDENVGNLFRFS